MVLCASFGGAGCTESLALSDWIPDWVPEWVLDWFDPDGQGAAVDRDPSLSPRPENSTAHSEYQVLTFQDVLFNHRLSREERIQAFGKLDPGALRTRVVPVNTAASNQAAVGPRTRDQAVRSSSPDLKGARGRVAITMYSTRWCGVCQRARKYMQDHGISFVEHDVDEEPGARAEYQKLNPRRSVPTIQIDDELLVGFSPQGLEAAIDRAAAKRS